MTGKGINSNLVPEAENSIVEYKNKLKDALEALKSDIDFSSAFIGQTQSDAINRFYGRVLDSVNETFAFLDSFKTTINEVATAYSKEESSVAEGVNAVNVGGGQ